MTVGANHLLLTDTLVHEFEIFRLQTISTTGQEMSRRQMGDKSGGTASPYQPILAVPG